MEVAAEEWLGQPITDDVNDRCWQILGFDVTIDSDFNPVIFEINSKCRQNIELLKSDADGNEYSVPSEFYPQIFIPPLTEMYKTMLGNPDTGGWCKYYESSEATHLLVERALEVFKDLSSDNTHLKKLTKAQFFGLGDMISQISTQELEEIFEKTVEDTGMSLEDFFEALEKIGEHIHKPVDELVAMLLE